MEANMIVDKCLVCRHTLVFLPRPDEPLQKPPLNETPKEREKRIEENERKAEKTINLLHSNESFEKVGDRIYAAQDKINSPNFQNELKIAKESSSSGSTVYLVSEKNKDVKHYDTITDGVKLEYKTVAEGNTSSLGSAFRKSREQSPNVWIDLEKSRLTICEIIRELFLERNRQPHTDKNGIFRKGYDQHNKFEGGTIILKLPGGRKLYIPVDSIKK